jgi:outer membrane murein-binding lipoprotein Lpp
MNMREHEELEQRVQALSEKVEKLDKDLKALVNDTYRQKEAE